MNPFAYLKLKAQSVAQKGGNLLWVAVVIAFSAGFFGHLLWWVARLGWNAVGFWLKYLPSYLR